MTQPSVSPYRFASTSASGPPSTSDPYRPSASASGVSARL